MEVFEGNLKFYHTLACFTGLWPSDKSVLTNIQRFVVVVMTLTCILTQMMTTRNAKMALNDIILLVSFTCTLLIYFSRYSVTVSTFPLMTFLYENMQKDYAEVKNNPAELELLMEDSIIVKRIVQLYFSMVCTGGLCLVATLLASALVNSDAQLHYLNLLGFFYEERSLQSSFTCLHITLTTVNGLILLTVTEGGVTVFTTYISGLLKVASYRLKTAVETVVFSGTTKDLDIRSAMEMHCRAIRYVDKYMADLVVYFLFFAILVAVGFGVNLYRFYLNVTNFSDRDALMLSIHFIVTYMVFLFFDNYSGQIMLNASADLHNDTYNTLWYLLPARMQKMVLFTMMRSQTPCQVNCAGLYIASQEGITVVLSASFSYFTLLCSMM